MKAEKQPRVLKLERRKPRQDVVTELEGLLARAKTGELRGLVVFAFTGPRECEHGAAGETQVTDVLWTLESFKIELLKDE